MWLRLLFLTIFLTLLVNGKQIDESKVNVEKGKVLDCAERTCACSDPEKLGFQNGTEHFDKKWFDAMVKAENLKYMQYGDVEHYGSLLGGRKISTCSSALSCYSVQVGGLTLRGGIMIIGYEDGTYFKLDLLLGSTQKPVIECGEGNKWTSNGKVIESIACITSHVWDK